MMTPAQLSSLVILVTLCAAFVAAFVSSAGLALETCQLTHSIDVCILTLR